MITLAQRIEELTAHHGSLRAAARVLETDAGYLSRLASGEKDDPGETLLRRMGLRRVVSYERRLPASSALASSQPTVNPAGTGQSRMNKHLPDPKRRNTPHG